MAELEEVTLGTGVTAPQEARAFVSSWLATRGLQSLRDRAELATSELVTNAVQHSIGGVGLSIEVEDHEVRIGVTDESTTMPVARATSQSEDGGRGLHILDAVTDRWGTEHLAADGKTIWCAFALPL
jgi:anti-sigma regulatory factor (Ser/Thr protein kinase)